MCTPFNMYYINSFTKEVLITLVGQFITTLGVEISFVPHRHSVFALDHNSCSHGAATRPATTASFYQNASDVCAYVSFNEVKVLSRNALYFPEKIRRRSSANWDSQAAAICTACKKTALFSLCARVNLAETSGGRIDISAAKRGECQMARKLGAKKRRTWYC